MKLSFRSMAAVVVAGVTMTACSAQTSSQSSAGDLPTDGSATAVAKEVTVWTNSADDKSVRAVYERFGKANGVKMNIVEIPADGFETQVQTKWASGDRPDILEYHATSLFWALNPSQNLVDLSAMPYVKKSGDLYSSVGSLNGKTYAAITGSPLLFDMFFNKKVFTRNGLQAPKTFDDLAKICATLREKDPDVTPIFESGGSSWPTQILPIMYLSTAQKDGNWAQQVLDKKTTLDAADSPFTAAVTAYKKLKDSKCFNSDATTAKFEDSVKAVSDGSAAMVALHTGLIPSFNEQFGGDTAKTDAAIGFAAPSAGGSVGAWAPGVSGTWYVPKTGNEDTERTALAFIQYATGEGYQEYLNDSKTFPVIQGATEPAGVQGLLKEVSEQYRSSSAGAANTNLVGMNAQFDKYMTGVLSGQQTPAEVAETAQKALEQGATAAALPGW